MPSVDQCWTPSQMQSLADEKDFHVLFGKLDTYIKALGFQVYSFSLVTDRFKFLISSFPSAGQNRYALMRALESDKVLAHCCWSELPLLWNAELFHDTPERWRDLQARGFCHGWVQPQKGDQGDFSCMTVLRAQPPVLCEEFYRQAPVVIWFGQLLHRAAASLLKGNGQTSQRD